MRCPKKYKFYWKLFGNFSFLLNVENKQTPKYQNFISAQNFLEDPKNTRFRILYPKKYDEHTYLFAMEMLLPPGAKLTIHMQKLCFLYD